jgi:hypothetical protein
LNKRHNFKPTEKEGEYKCLDCLQVKYPHNKDITSAIEPCAEKIEYNRIYSTHDFHTRQATGISPRGFRFWLPEETSCKRCGMHLSFYKPLKLTCDEWIIKGIIE